MSAGHVAVVGGGCTGILQAVALLRCDVPRVTLVERSDRLARGAAYGTRSASHLLNVRAGTMSAYTDRPDHFAAWLAARGEEPDGFAQRRLYGAYLEEVLDEARSEAGDRLRVLRGEATDVRSAASGEEVGLRAGGTISADAVILSLGNLAPAAPRGIRPHALPADIYVADPWRAGLAAGLTDRDTIILIGTGLTAIDAALLLDDAGFRGQILAVSRRGLVPRAHGEARPPEPPPDPLPAAGCLDLLRFVRSEGEALGWRSAVDRFRTVTQQLWISARVEERRRFLRHLRPWWDVHRHRIAPQIAARIERMEREGRLQFAAGRIIAVEAKDGSAELVWRPRGEDRPHRIAARRIVNCTGPSGDIAAADEALLANLLRAGRVRPDPCRIGLDVDGQCRALDSSGRASRSLYAVGPLTRGTFWEIVAVPDLRDQVDDLARALGA